MSLRAIKAGDPRAQAGDFDDPIRILERVETKDASLGVQSTFVERWNLFAMFTAGGADENRTALREAGFIYASFTIPYLASRIPLEGWQIERKLTGDRFEIRGVQPVDRQVCELFARMVR